MKTRNKALKSLIVLCSSVILTSAFGQIPGPTVYTWTGAADGTNLATAGNWTTNGTDPATTLPIGGDTAQWNGLTTSNLTLTYGSTGWPGTGTAGVNFFLSANQTNSVQIISTVPLSAELPIFGITDDSPNAAFTLGDSSANNLVVFARPAGAVHPFVNASSASCTINPSVKWQAGGGTGYTYDFSGTGNWTADSFLMPDNGFFANFVQVEGPGSVFWTPNKRGTYNPDNDSLAGVSINGGALVIEFRGAFGSASAQPIMNNSILDFEAASTNNGVISGSGQLIVGGDLTLTANNTYTGTTTVNAGMLFVNGGSASSATIVNAGAVFGGTGTLSGPVTMNAGSTLLPSTGEFGLASLGTLTINNNLTIGGNLIIDVNKSVSPSNDLVVVSGFLTNTGTGTLTVRNLGGAIPCVSGDEFTLFNKPLLNGAALSVDGANLNWVNNLAVDGSITVSSLPYQFTWTGAADGTNLATAGNFTIDGVHAAPTPPNSQNVNAGVQVPVIWNGLTTSNLVLIFGGTGWGNAGLGTIGNNLIATTNQANSVQVISQAALSPGMGLLAITNNSPHSAFILGDNTANLLTIITRPAGATHNFVNNSTAACIINPNVNWEAGGGNPYSYDFGGTGNWVVNNYLMPENGAFGSSTVQVDGPGTVIWSAGAAGNYIPNSILGSIVINGGALVLSSAFAGNNNQLLNTAITNSTSLTYAPSNGTDAQTFNGVISGTGQLIVNGGTLTLGGNDTYSGFTTVSNGTLALAATGSISNSSSINLSTGTTLDASAAGGLRLVSGQTLTGNGAVNGNLDVTNGATIAPGFPVGALTVKGNLTIEGAATMDIDKAAGTNDVLTAGSITYGGTLMVNFVSTPPALNDSYRLFVSAGANYSGAFSSIVPATPGAGLAWDTGSLAVNGILKVAVATSPYTNASITKVALSGANVVIHGTNNNVPNTNFHYVVVTASNLSTALSNWTPVVTNGFNADGTFDYTNPMVPGAPQQFIDVKAVP